MTMFEKLIQAFGGTVVLGGAGGKAPGEPGQGGKAYGPGAVAGRPGIGAGGGRGGDAIVIGKGRAVGGDGGDVIDGPAK